MNDDAPASGAPGGSTPPVSSVAVPVDLPDASGPHHRHQAGRTALMVAALGVVFGDLGTSPLYAVQTAFGAGELGIPLTEDGDYGIISMVSYVLLLVVAVKYVSFVMRADNGGEGGIMALTALVSRLRSGSAPVPLALFVTLGVFGAALFFGDAMITPAISVLSAVEGLTVVSSELERFVLPITLTVLGILFAVQRFGTAAVGRLFGPVMLVFFGAIAAAGIGQIVAHPDALKALSPTYAITFALDRPGLTFAALAGVSLTITGAEALYADMGHFSRRIIARAWFFVVFPALTLNYLGQGAVILHEPGGVERPFFLMFPDWSLIPLVLLATAATVIASQSVISGAFSLARQAVQLGYLPRLLIRHTSRAEIGQVYVPAMNWILLVGVVTPVLGFRTSEALAAAFGVAVTGLIAITSLLYLAVARRLFGAPAGLIALGSIVFLSLDLLLFAANLGKIADGGWFPVTVALITFAVFTTWFRGRVLVDAARTEDEGPLIDFVEALKRFDPAVQRVPGTAIFLNANPATTPLVLRANVEHNHTLHQTVVIASVEIGTVPNVADADRIVVDDLGHRDDGILHLTIRYGFSDRVDIPAALTIATGLELEREVDVAGASYFLSRVQLRRGPDPSMPRWRKALFLLSARFAANPAEYFHLPMERTIVMGGHMTI